MRPLLKKIAPGFLSSYITRNTGARTGSSKVYADGSHNPRSQQRTQQEIDEHMNREMDRQLEEFEMTEHNGKESETSESELVEVNEKRKKKRDANPV